MKRKSKSIVFLLALLSAACGNKDEKTPANTKPSAVKSSARPAPLSVAEPDNAANRQEEARGSEGYKIEKVPVPREISISLNRVLYDDYSHEATEDDWRKLAFMDIRLAVSNSHLMRGQDFAINRFLTSRNKTKVSEVVGMLFDRPIAELFPDERDLPANRFAFGFLHMLGIKYHYPSFPEPVNGHFYSKDDVPIWKQWWSENKDKLDYANE